MLPHQSSPPPGWGTRGIDDLLRAFPAGRLSEIVGPRSSGGSGLLVALLARATAQGAQVALVDGADGFDPAGALAAGVDLGRLLWVRCGGHWRKAWSAADLLARCPGFAVVALDLAALGRRDPGAAVLCLRLQRAVERSAAALVLRAPCRLAGAAADLVIETRRVEARWQGQPRPTRLAGFVSEVLVVRARPGAAARSWRGGEAWRIEWRL
jgi:hypothetical protein